MNNFASSNNKAAASFMELQAPDNGEASFQLVASPMVKSEQLPALAVPTAAKKAPPKEVPRGRQPRRIWSIEVS
jgi:hypothetical protein